METAEKVRRTLGDAHLVDVYDGVANRRFECRRCFRRMPENMFVMLGPRFSKGKKAMTALHPHCHTCRKQAKGKWIDHPLYTIHLDGFFTRYMTGLRSGALSRTIYFGIDADDVLGKFLDQDGRCALTGIKLEPFKTSGRLKSGKYLASPSVDRIDSTMHYTPDNIQIVMWAVNVMKSDLPQEVFIELCHQISIKNLI